MKAVRVVNYGIVLLMYFSGHLVSALEQSPTGFYYPTGNAPSAIDTGWLASDADYFLGKCHIGHDFIADYNDPVYPISDGEVYFISPNGWGIGNIGIVVKHILQDGNEFLAVYGHIQQNNLQSGSKVYTTVPMGNVGNWPYGDHVHLGILPSLSYPSSGLGLTDSPCALPYNGFVDPINWLNTRTPAPNHTTSLVLLRSDFNSPSSDDWTTGYDTQTTSDQDPVDQDTWKVVAQGLNPGVVSPELPAGTTTAGMILRFSAKVRGTGPDTYCQIWIKDGNGNWNHEVRVYSVDGQAGNVVKRDYQYHEYTAFLDDVGNIPIRQFSIELTQDADYEEWIFDWVRLSYGGVGGPEPTATPIPTPTTTPPGVIGGNHPDPQQPGFPMNYTYTGSEYPVELQFRGGVPSAIVLQSLIEHPGTGNPLVQIALAPVAQFGIYEITQEQYAAFNPTFGFFYNIGENTPVRHVTLADARAFCDWLNYYFIRCFFPGFSVG